jgi:nucleotide-binding universal stress UspA family protein
MTESQVFGRILVPVDGSVSSLVAQELAALIAKKFGSRIAALHVVSHEFMRPSVQSLSPESERYDFAITGMSDMSTPVTKRIPRTPPVELPDEVYREITNSFRQKGEEVLGDAVADFKEDGISVDQKLIEDSSPAEAIVRQAQEMNCDLIVMGRSAGEEKSKPHLGSVAAKVSGRAPIPVLVAGEGKRISKILVPVDGSEASMRAADRAATLAKKIDASITLLYVQESGLFKPRSETARKIGTTILSNIASRMKDAKMDQKMEQGDAGHTITDIAEKEDYDLIVMGGTGHSTIGHFFIGSVSDHVLHYTDRAVLLVK